VESMRSPPGTETSSAHTVKILSVSSSDADHAALSEILQAPEPNLEMNCRCMVQPASTMASTAEALAQEEISIVIAECSLSSGTWQTILEIISQVAQPPLLIVASRVADERLWAEALNLGAWDVLAKPFDNREVIRVVAGAWRHWEEAANSGPDTKPRKANVTLVARRTQVEEIILRDEQLKTLEKQFGPSVWKMGSWNSDGTFGYVCISFAVIENAAESTGDPNVITALSRLNSAAEPTKALLEVLETFGHSLIEQIVAAYRRRSFEFIPVNLCRENRRGKKGKRRRPRRGSARVSRLKSALRPRGFQGRHSFCATAPIALPHRAVSGFVPGGSLLLRPIQ
jgi:FixJ family two-component response regulator